MTLLPSDLIPYLLQLSRTVRAIIALVNLNRTADLIRVGKNRSIKVLPLLYGKTATEPFIFRIRVLISTWFIGVLLEIRTEVRMLVIRIFFMLFDIVVQCRQILFPVAPFIILIYMCRVLCLVFTPIFFLDNLLASISPG